MRFKFPAEAVGQSGEASEAHTEAQIGSLHDAGANAFGVRLTHDWDNLHCGYFSR